jgi:Pyridoxamine 5'-phosphate oxidase
MNQQRNTVCLHRRRALLNPSPWRIFLEGYHATPRKYKGEGMSIQEMMEAVCLSTLAAARLGRLACVHESQPYIVPIYFAYEHPYVYAFTTRRSSDAPPRVSGGGRRKTAPCSLSSGMP